MSIDSKHPLYNDRMDEWTQLKDTHRGQAAVKAKKQDYLPATSGMVADGMNAGQPGEKAYNAYLKRSVFPDLMVEAVEGMAGIMHREAPIIEVPKRLEPMLEKATDNGEPLKLLLRKINEQQLIYGRLGLLLEVPDGLTAGEAIPFIVPYKALRTINWDAGSTTDGRQRLQFVVLDESKYEIKNTFEWELKNTYRLLSVMGDGTEANPPGVYQAALVREDEGNQVNFITPSIGGNTLDQIPFVFVNASDLVPEPSNPPLMGISNLALTIYRGEADYRQALFQTAQETLVIIGREEQTDSDGETRVGAGAVLDLPVGGDAKYVGVSAAGLDQMAKALEADRLAAQAKGTRLLQDVEGNQQSGEALRIRVAASTATLTSIAVAGATGLEAILKLAAVWVGANPDEVKVTPNLDFSEDELSGKELLDFMSAKNLGAPISLESIHRLLKQRDLTDKEFEEELELINNEEPLVDPLPTDPGNTFEDDERV